MGQRDNFYDCIRALAAVLVLFTHYNGWLPGGSLGVSMFFCLSGFLICRILLRIEISPSNIARFIFRRFMRVWPLMAFQILLVLLCMALLAPQNLPKYIPDIGGLITFTRGYRVWVGGSPAVLWTLRAEFWFYVLFPLVLCAAGKARVAGCIVGGIAIAWLSKGLIGQNHGGWLNQFGIFTRPLAKMEPFVFTLLYLDQLMYGAACAVLIERKSAVLRYFQSRFFLWAPLLAVCLLATIPFRAYDRVWYMQTSAAALLTAILILHHAQRATRHDFEPIATLGRISFSIYLLHIVVVDYFPSDRFNAQLGTVLAFTMIIGASLMTYRWIEQPAIALSKRLAPFSSRVPLQSVPLVALQALPSQAE